MNASPRWALRRPRNPLPGSFLQRTGQYDTHHPPPSRQSGRAQRPPWRRHPASLIFATISSGTTTMDAKSNNKTATLTVGNKSYDFPILSGTVGPDVIDIAKLYAQAGMFTYDPGFTSTGSCQSKITYIDGDAG